jgi:predicted transcriptional regulator
VSLNNKHDADNNDAINTYTNNRSVDDRIVLGILSTANGGASEEQIKSQIPALASDGNLLRQYIDLLIRSELLGLNDTMSNQYVTTAKGLRFLEAYERVGAGSDKKEPPKGFLHIS